MQLKLFLMFARSVKNCRTNAYSKLVEDNIEVDGLMSAALGMGIE